MAEQQGRVLDTYQNTPSFICFPSLGATGQCVDVCDIIKTALEEAEGKVQRERMERLKQQGVCERRFVVVRLGSRSSRQRGPSREPRNDVWDRVHNFLLNNAALLGRYAINLPGSFCDWLWKMDAFIIDYYKLITKLRRCIKLPTSLPWFSLQSPSSTTSLLRLSLTPSQSLLTSPSCVSIQQSQTAHS